MVALYNIDINGQRHLVKGDNFTTTLPTGLSIIKISTNLDCQGVIEREIFISEDILYYPNPTDQDVSVHVSGEDTTVQVSVFSEKGDLIYTREQDIADVSRKTNIDLVNQIPGTYIVVLESKTVRKTKNKAQSWSLYKGMQLYYTLEKGDLKNLVFFSLLALTTYFVHGFLNNFLDTDKLAVPFWGFISIIVVVDIYHKKKTS